LSLIRLTALGLASAAAFIDIFFSSELRVEFCGGKSEAASDLQD
jgi:hypothetical protein